MNTMRGGSGLLLATILTLVAACTSAADRDADAEPTQSASAEAATASADIDQAPEELQNAVAARYDDMESPVAVTGTAALGTWGEDEIAVVTGTGDFSDDVTLAATENGQWTIVGGWWPSAGEQGATDLGEPTHILVLGSDARPGERVDASRADTIQLLGFDGQGGAGVMGFARDLWVEIAGHGNNKINAALVFGGPESQLDTVANLTDIDISGYVLTGFEGFTSLVDAAGGLEFDAPSAIPGRSVPLAAGPQTLTGEGALIWARERKQFPGGDFDRSRHQGLLLLAAADMLRTAGIDAAPQALELADRFTESNVSGADMLRFVAAFYDVDPAKIGHTVAKGGFGVAGGGQSIVNLDQAARDAITDFADGSLSTN